jgi:hypothetical protein
MLAMARNPLGQTRPPDNIFIRAPAIVSPIKPPANPVTESQTFRAAPPTAESKMDTPKTGTRQREDPNI